MQPRRRGERTRRESAPRRPPGGKGSSYPLLSKAPDCVTGTRRPMLALSRGDSSSPRLSLDQVFRRLAADGRRNRELRQPVLEPLELGCVGFELGGAGSALPQDLAHQYEASDVQQQIVDLPHAHAASSAGTRSPSTVSTSGTAGLDS